MPVDDTAAGNAPSQAEGGEGHPPATAREVSGCTSGAPDLRVPNALIRELANPDPDSFWRLIGHRAVVTALGLLSLVDLRRPEREVTTKVTTILDIIETAQKIAQTFAREWTRADGTVRSREYDRTKHRPKVYAEVGEALVDLFARSFHIVTVGYTKPKGHGDRPVRKETHLEVHFLDSFGFVYVDRGKPVDLALVRPDQKVNVSRKPERPVYKLPDRHPSGIVFRLNTELARELVGRGRRYTIVLGAVFGLLRELAGDPAALRVALWLVSQRELTVRRNRRWLITKLVAGRGNLTIAQTERRLDDVLDKLRDLKVLGDVQEKPYAARSRKRGTYLELRKVTTWHVGLPQEASS